MKPTLPYKGGIIGLVVSDFKPADRRTIERFFESFGGAEICVNAPPRPDNELGICYQNRNLPALLLAMYNKKK
jgi:hypothetical protein